MAPGEVTENVSVNQELRERVEKIEEAYEFFLAYAAQGLSGEGADGQVRVFLDQMLAALDGLGDRFRTLAREVPLQPEDVWLDFVDVLEGDAVRARSAVALVAAKDTVSSQLVDNMNANSHVRAMLTDVFLMDSALG